MKEWRWRGMTKMNNYLRGGDFGIVSRHIQCRESKIFNVLLERKFFILWCFLHCDPYPSLKAKPINRFTGWWFLHQHQTKFGFFVIISEPLVMILSMCMCMCMCICLCARERERESDRKRQGDGDGKNEIVLFINLEAVCLWALIF